MLPVQQAGYNGDVDIPGLPPHSASFFAEYRWITGDYFGPWASRSCADATFLPEELSGARHAVIINQTMAHTLWRDRDPVGWTLKLNESAALNGVAYTVIGVAQDVRQSGLDVPARSEIEFPLSTMPAPLTDQAIVVRTSLPEAAILHSIRSRICGCFKTNPMHGLPSGEQCSMWRRRPRRFSAKLLEISPRLP